MATVYIYPEIANILQGLIESSQNGDFESLQLTLTDQRGVPVDICIVASQEVDYE